MNPTTTQPPPPSLPPPSLPPPPQLQPHRPSTSCDRHPQENFTGFCPSCLCERLAVLDPNSSSSSAAARKPPSSSAAAAALKTIFRSSVAARRPPLSSLPELRRTKSFSASKNEALSGFFEPQRKSCDVRGRSTLFTLFNQEAEVETRNLPSSSVVQKPVLESEEEDDDEEDNIVVHDVTDIKVSESPQPQQANAENRVSEIIEEESETVPEPVEADVADEDALKAMKDHMDLDSQTKKTSGRDLKGSFWSAASVFSKKLQKWRQKQKMKKRERNGVVVGSGTLLPVEKPIARQFRETQSEIADYGFGRRSCDTDPRFSLDAARMSFDFEEPRASWDGYLMARTAPTFAVPPRMPTMIEDVPAPVQVLRTDSLIPVEEPEYEETLTLNLNQNLNLSVNHNANVNANPDFPGGSTQTREYYTDSSSRRRKSLDRSSSIRRTAAAVVAEMDELKSVSNASATTNAKVTPAASADYVHNPLRDSNLNSNSLRDDGCEKAETEESANRERYMGLWQKGYMLGKGSFGTVYEAFADDGNFFAAKEVSLLDDRNQGKQSIFQLRQEISLLSQFRHDNIVQYLGTGKDNDKLYIFLELVTKGSLANLYKKYRLMDSQVSAYTRQILSGLKYLHDRNVIHRDIKCANILVDATGSVKLADFGLAKVTKLNNVNSVGGSLYWMAPEVVNLRSRGYGLAADIWSLGCTVLEMLTRQPPYSHLEPLQAIFQIEGGEPPLVPESISTNGRDFILKCLQADPNKRPTASQLLDHPFVNICTIKNREQNKDVDEREYISEDSIFIDKVELDSI